MINKVKHYTQKVLSIDSRTIGLIAVLLVALSVTYGSAKIIHKNYGLEQQITELRNKNALQEQINANQKLKNQYYTTDDYLDIAARRFFNKAAPGETLVLVPEKTALSYTTPPPEALSGEDDASTPEFIQNWRIWLDFLSGEPIET